MSEQEHFYTVENGRVYTLISGRWKVECLPYMDDIMRAGSALLIPDAPEIPTYTFIDADGDTETKEYTQAAIDDPNTPEEDREKWAVYLVEKAAYDIDVGAIKSQQAQMKARVFAYRALRNEWAKEREEFYGIPVPDDEKDRKMAFVLLEVGRDEMNAIRISAGCAKAQGVDQEVLDLIEERFRNPLGESEGQDAQTDTATITAGEQEETPGLVDGDAVDVVGHADPVGSV
ncbi:MAG: hypothetical protein ACYSW6_10870 [Planctomycetota bacterium]|jgi:hypothetical protein